MAHNTWVYNTWVYGSHQAFPERLMQEGLRRGRASKRAPGLEELPPALPCQGLPRPALPAASCSSSSTRALVTPRSRAARTPSACCRAATQVRMQGGQVSERPSSVCARHLRLPCVWGCRSAWLPSVLLPLVDLRAVLVPCVRAMLPCRSMPGGCSWRGGDGRDALNHLRRPPAASAHTPQHTRAALPGGHSPCLPCCGAAARCEAKAG